MDEAVANGDRLISSRTHPSSFTNPLLSARPCSTSPRIHEATHSKKPLDWTWVRSPPRGLSSLRPCRDATKYWMDLQGENNLEWTTTMMAATKTKCIRKGWWRGSGSIRATRRALKTRNRKECQSRMGHNIPQAQTIQPTWSTTE